MLLFSAVLIVQYVPVERSDRLNSKVWTVVLSFGRLSNAEQCDEFVQFAEVLSDHQPSGDVSHSEQPLVSCIWRFWTQPRHGPIEFVRVPLSGSWQENLMSLVFGWSEIKKGSLLNLLFLDWLCAHFLEVVELWLLSFFQTRSECRSRRQDFLDLMHQTGEALNLQPLMVKEHQHGESSEKFPVGDHRKHFE